MNKKEIVGDLLNQLRCAHSLLAGRHLCTHQQLRGTQHSQRYHCISREWPPRTIAPCRLIRQRATYEGMPAGVSRSKLNTTLAQLLVLSDHLDQIIGEHS